MDSTATPGEEWPELHRARRVIVVVDVVESVRLMERDEAGFIAKWRSFVAQVRHELLPVHAGRLVKSLGDGLLLEFEQVSQALHATQEMLKSISRARAGVDAEDTIALRVGIHLANVVVDDIDVYGTGVNLAARLAGLAGAGEVVVSAAVRDELVAGLDPECDDLGDCFVKHMHEAVRAFRVRDRPGAQPRHRRAAPAPTPSLTPALLVLPLDCSADDSSLVVAGDLLHDSIVSALAARSELRVLSRLSALRLAGRGELPQDFLDTLGADFVLSGSCRVLAGHLVLTLELTDARSRQAVWTTQGRSTISALLDPHCELVETVASGVACALVQVETCRADSQPLPTLRSHELQLGAVTLMHRSSGDSFDRVHDMLEHLIERHARVAGPRAWMAKWHVLRMTRGLVADPQEEARRALDQTRRAVDADPGCALALAMEGFVHCHLRRDLETASQRLDEAIAAGPSEPLAWLFRGVVHAFRDEGGSAWQCAERALELSPIDPLRYYFESLAAASALAAGRLERAADLAQRSLRANRMHTSTYRTLAIAQVLGGNAGDAHQTVKRLLELEPDFSVARFLARAPAGSSPIGLRFAQALAEAGVPAGR